MPTSEAQRLVGVAHAALDQIPTSAAPHRRVHERQIAERLDRNHPPSRSGVPQCVLVCFIFSLPTPNVQGFYERAIFTPPAIIVALKSSGEIAQVLFRTLPNLLLFPSDLQPARRPTYHVLCLRRGPGREGVVVDSFSVPARLTKFNFLATCVRARHQNNSTRGKCCSFRSLIQQRHNISHFHP